MSNLRKALHLRLNLNSELIGGCMLQSLICTCTYLSLWHRTHTLIIEKQGFENKKFKGLGENLGLRIFFNLE